MPDWRKNNYFMMAAWDKSLECVRKLSLTQKGLEVFVYVIKFERNQALEFLPPKKEIQVNYTDPLLLSWCCMRFQKRED